MHTPPIIQFGAASALTLHVFDPVFHLTGALPLHGTDLALIIVAGSVAAHELIGIATRVLKRLRSWWRRRR